MNLLLQILEEGRITDSLGRKIDFRNTIIIMTSNLGADLIKKSTEVGFQASNALMDYKAMEQKFTAAAKKHFKPEFINRLDDMVSFNMLNKESLSAIVDLEFKKLQKRLLAKKIYLEIDEKAKAFLVDKGYQPDMGARPLRRAIEQHLEDPLAEKLLAEPVENCKFLVSATEGKIVFIDQELNEKQTAVSEENKEPC